MAWGGRDPCLPLVLFRWCLAGVGGGSSRRLPSSPLPKASRARIWTADTKTSSHSGCSGSERKERFILTNYWAPKPPALRSALWR